MTQEKTNKAEEKEAKSHATNFVKNIITEDLKSGKRQAVVTRFPPEPNGYLHIGHAKSINLNFGLARDFEGTCHLRFDDTNPEKEETEYVESIKRDVKWLGFNWGEKLFHASDYFERIYQFAVQLIKAGKAYICELSPEEMRAYRGTLKEPGKNSPYRDRPIEENLEIFEGMRAGKFEEGKYVLRAKIDMASGNVNMRDPIIYRIKYATHQMTGDKWCIYPMYDFTHCLSDSLENITHSVCTLEFEAHRPLYDWVLDELELESHPQQIEFSRLFLEYTVMSKRKLIDLVQGDYVHGWDDPRMPTIQGMRRRGYTPDSIKNFCNRIGVSKSESWTDMSLLEDCVREDLNEKAPRAMAVLDPIKLVIENYPEDQEEEITPPVHPQKPELGRRSLPFCREIYIDRDDFMEDPPKKFFRLGPGREVRLRNAYAVKCEEVIKNEQGEVVELRCTYDPESKGGKSSDGRKIKGIVHWVSARHAVKAEVRVYDRLFTVPNPDADKEKKYTDFLNPDSLKVLRECYVEPGLAEVEAEQCYQFERLGYFAADADSKPDLPVFNRTVTLRDSWAKAKK